MSPFIETIKLLDGVLENLTYHQERFERTRKETLGLKRHPLLEKIIQVPDGLDHGLFKCRVIYGRDVDRIEFELQEKRVITSLKVVVSETIAYGYKYSDRSELDTLFRMRDTCDDILIVKNGCITDSYYANVAFWDGSGWFTPDTPLLPGTMRASLLATGSMEEKRIRATDLVLYQKIRLINAMNHLRESTDIPIDRVLY